MMGDGWMAGPLPWLAVLVFTLLFHLGILANPGFYSHDEWEKFDQLRALGLWDAVRPYLRLQAGAEFGHPVRPVGFVQQLVSAHWMAMAPFLPHLVDVLLHALVSVVVLFALRDAGAAPGLSLLVALAFSASPLTTTATGWVGASFDQWYVLFACLAGWAAWRAATEGLTFRRCLWLLAAAAGAILSKEAAVMLPAAIVLMLGLAWLERGSLRNRPAILAILLALLPIAAYLLLRLPALQASFAGQAHATYAPSLGHVWTNALGYFAFPFIPHGGDFPPVSPWHAPRILVGAGLHALLVVALVAYAGPRHAVVYVLAYGVFLLPVLSLPHPASHYLYGSALAMALTTGFVLRAAWLRRHRVTLAVTVLGLAVMTANALSIQLRLYKDGMCQANFLASLETHLAGAQASRVLITAAPGARSWVGRRAIHDRTPFQDAAGLPRAAFADQGAVPAAGTVAVTMGRDCLLR
jgi:hypothetical protein